MEEKFFTKEELGMTKFPKEVEGMKVIPAQVETKTTKIEDNYNQTMVDKKFQHAAKPWKPIGRK